MILSRYHTPLSSAWGSGLWQADAARRQIGLALDRLGLGAIQSPFRTVLAGPLSTLRAYGAPPGDGPVLLIVPAPIKRGYLWDLAPGMSVVRRCLESGLGVYMIYWETPGVGERGAGLRAYADGSIMKAAQAVTRECGARPLFLAGHSLGGTMAAIFAALHPEQVGGLVLVESPLHFDPRLGLLDAAVARGPRADYLTAGLDLVPGALLDLASHQAAPLVFGGQPALDRLAAGWSSPGLAIRHLRAVRWMLDELPMPRRLFVETVEWLYREDRFARGRLFIGRRRARLEEIRAPALCVVDPRSRLVPPGSMIDPLNRGGPRELATLVYSGDPGVALQHLGPLIGQSAHEGLWPRITAWIHRQAHAR